MNNKVYLISTIKPISLNIRKKDGKTAGEIKEKYYQNVSNHCKNAYEHLYSFLPFCNNKALLSYLIYFHNSRDETPFDVDNIIKPFVDAFRNTNRSCAYPLMDDDKAIVKSSGVKIIVSDEYIMNNIDFSDIPYEIYFDLIDHLNNDKEYIILYKLEELEKNENVMEDF